MYVCVCEEGGASLVYAWRGLGSGTNDSTGHPHVQGLVLPL